MLGFVVYTSLLLPLALAEAAVHDVALVPWVTLAMLAFYDAAMHRHSRATIGLGALAGLSLGLAILTKALTGVVLVGLPFAAWCVAGRKLRPSVVLAGVVEPGRGGRSGGALVRRHGSREPRYLHYYFVERHLLGYTTTTQLHGQRPWWYYVPVLIGGAMPWVVYLCAPLRRLLAAWTGRARSDEHGALELLVLWVAVDVTFLSFAGSKLVTYILPVFPAIAVLAACAWARALADGSGEAHSRAWRAAHAIACVSMAVVLPGAVFVAAQWFGLVLGPVSWAAAGAASLAWLGVLVVALKRPGRQVLTAMVGALAVTVAVGLVVLLPAAAPSFTARDLARHYNREGRLPGTVWFYDERVGSFLFYLDAPLRATLTSERVVRARPELLLALRHAPADTVIVVPVEELPRLERRIPLGAQPSVLAGHHRAYTAEDFVAALRIAVDGPHPIPDSR